MLWLDRDIQVRLLHVILLKNVYPTPHMKFNDLDPFQADAITALDNGKSVLVGAPTGTGKTIIADWLADRALTRKRHIIYTADHPATEGERGAL